MKLKISDDLSLPLDFITCTQAILAIKRVGKSYTASVQAEELLKAGQQIVAIDVTGAWWGLRSNAAGDGPGFPVVIFGGDHGDITLEEGAGEVLAEAIVTERFSAIIDLSLFRKAQAQRFLAVFFETLYRKNREAMHIFMDEADFYAPQKPFGEEARTLGAVNDIVRRGGIRGIGCTLITQRASVLNKDVLTQAGIVTALRISHPRDMAAILEWVDVHSSRKDAQAMMAALPSLPIGTAYVWAPGWPTEGGIFERIKIRERETFNSGATPKAGHVIRQPKVMAKLDIQKLGQQIISTVQRQKENDPKELKAKIRELEQAAKSAKPAVDEQAIQKAVQQAVAQRDDEWIAAVGDYDYRIVAAVRGVPFTAPNKPATLPPAVTPKFSPAPVQRRPAGGSIGDIQLRPGACRMLAACAQWRKPISEAQVAAQAGVKRTGGSFSSYKSNLVTAGLISVNGGLWSATAEGMAYIGSNGTQSPQSTEEVLAIWKPKFRPGAARMLDVLISYGGESVAVETLAEQSGVSADGGSFSSYLSNLATADLIVKPQRGMVAANREALFL